MIRRFLPTFLGALAIGGAIPAGSAGDGLPVGGGDTTRQGVLAPNGDHRFLAFSGEEETTLARVATGGGEAVDWMRIPGRFTVPSVTLDGSTEGLSLDGRTLVLIRPRITFPQSRTELAVIDTERMRLKDRVRLDGDFSYDAISPDGETAYLIEYVDGRDYLRYDVRAYDLERGRLLSEPIVDPREPDEEMGGLPYDRLWTANGRWAYTLYANPEGHSFVHALDTVGRTAACIDLDMLEGHGDLAGHDLAFGPGGDELIVNGRGGEPVALIDASTFRVSEPAGEPIPSTAADQAETGLPAWAIGLIGWIAVALVAMLAWPLRSLMRRRRASTVEEMLDLGREPEAPGDEATREREPAGVS